MAFISEIHYLNSVASSTGVSEYVEVTLSPDDFARAGDFQIVTYEQDGTVSDSVTLSDLTPFIDPTTGFYIYTFETITTDPNGGDGNAEAIALIDNSLADPVLSFFDIGAGTSEIVAADGTPAAGAESVNIAAATGQSIQFDIFGNRIDGDLTEDSSVVCFATGTLISTPDGDAAIETLNLGDLVTTLDNGPKAIRWIGSRKLSVLQLRAMPHLQPIRIKAGALAENVPAKDLVVSPQHRILVRSKIAIRMFDVEEVFVPAKKLLGLPGVAIADDLTEVTYWHAMCEDHEIIEADGHLAETLYTGTQALKAMSSKAKQEIDAVFGDQPYMNRPLVRLTPQGKRAEQLVARHVKNGKELQIAV